MLLLKRETTARLHRVNIKWSASCTGIRIHSGRDEAGGRGGTRRGWVLVEAPTAAGRPQRCLDLSPPGASHPQNCGGWAAGQNCLKQRSFYTPWPWGVEDSTTFKKKKRYIYIYFNTWTIILSLYRICYDTASVLGFGYLVMRHIRF